MQVAAAAAGAEVQAATAACNKTQHRLASLEASAAAFADAQHEVAALQEVCECVAL